MIPFKSLAFFLLVAIVPISAARAQGPIHTYSVQIAASRSPEEAQREAAAWTSEGWAPIEVRADDPWSLVVYGRFSDAAEAWTYAEEFRARNLSPKAIVRAFEQNGGEVVDQNSHAFAPSVAAPSAMQYSVQLATYKDAADAAPFVGRLRGLGYGATYLDRRGQYEVLHLGPFATVAEASAYCEDFRAAGLVPDALVRVEPATRANGADLAATDHSRQLLEQLRQANAAYRSFLRNRSGVDPDRIYCVQLGFFTVAADAMALRDEILAQGYAPVFVLEEGPKSRVLFGHFEVFAEAHLYARDLRSQGLIDGAFVHPVEPERLAPAAAAAANTGALSRVFEFAAPPGAEASLRAPRPEVFLRAEDATATAVGGGLPNLRRAGEATDLLEAPPLPSQESAYSTGYGVAVRRYAMRQRDSGDLEGAVYLNKLVADGKVEATGSMRLQAAWDVARDLHRSRSRLRAYQAYRELAATCSKAEDTADCRRETIGLTMELAQSGVGRMGDVRKLIRQSLDDDFPTSSTDILFNDVRQHLIYAESFAKEERYAEAVDHLQAFLDAYEGNALCRRETAAALIWLGIAHAKSGDREQSSAAFEKVVGLLRMDERERFGSESFDAIAARWLFADQHRQGDIEGMRLWLNYLEQQYPNRHETVEAKRLLERYLAQ